MLQQREAWTQKGFWSHVMQGLRDVPTQPGDLVTYFECHSNCPVDFLRATEEEAWADAKRDLERQRQVALRDLKALPGLARDSEYSRDQISEWLTQAERSLAVADAGLVICESRTKRA